jgi:hypothetical protein
MKKPKFEEKEIARWMNNLSDKAFIAFFYTHLADRHIYAAEQRYMDSHLVLANAKRTLKDDVKYEDWHIELLCPTPGQDWVNDAPVCQFGTHCHHNTASVSKTSQCPVCREQASGS